MRANGQCFFSSRGNLENTLSICHRAKQTLDKTQQNKQTMQRTRDGKMMTARDYVELTSIEEYRKFRSMKPISQADVEAIDFEELSRRLLDS